MGKEINLKLDGKVNVKKDELQDNITKLKAEIFDILTQQGSKQLEIQNLEQIKNNKITELNELLKKQSGQG